MDKEINDQNYPIKKSYNYCQRVLMLLILPVMLVALIFGISFHGFVAAPQNTNDLFLALGCFCIMIIFMLYYWSDKITFQIDHETYSHKSRSFGEYNFPFDCIDSAQVPVDLGHRTIFELIGNYYRVVFYVDKNKLYATSDYKFGSVSNESAWRPTLIAQLSGLSKEDAIEIAQKVTDMINNRPIIDVNSPDSQDNFQAYNNTQGQF